MIGQPRWINKQALMLLHAESLAEHGGPEGIRDEALLDSALARPINHLLYSASADLPTLAAKLAFGIARNHPFVDGNKRVAFLSVGLFMALNGYQLVADKAEATSFALALAAGQLSEENFADWIREHITEQT